MFPGKTLGQIHVIEIPLGPLLINPVTNKIQTPALSIISAHSSNIAAITISDDGSLIATASIKGTLVRVFNSLTGKKSYELRRGMDQAEIYSLHFNKKNTRIVAASDKGTIHVFNLCASNESKKDPEPEDVIISVQQHSQGRTIEKAASGKIAHHEKTPAISKQEPSANRQSSLAFISPFLPKYFSSEWSFAYAKLPVETRCICAFAEIDILDTPSLSTKETVAVVGNDGSFYSLVFDGLKGGEMEMDRFFWYF